MKRRFGSWRIPFERPSLSQEALRLETVAVATDGLKVRVLERRASGSDLDDMVDVQLTSPTPAVTDLTGVVVSKQHVGTGGVPEVVPVELPLALPRTVRAPMMDKCTPALDASSGAPCLCTTAGPVGEPRCREGNDPAVRAHYY